MTKTKNIVPLQPTPPTKSRLYERIAKFQDSQKKKPIQKRNKRKNIRSSTDSLPELKNPSHIQPEKNQQSSEIIPQEAMLQVRLNDLGPPESQSYLIPVLEPAQNPQNQDEIKVEKYQEQCQICFAMVDDINFEMTFECEHRFCQNCINTHIKQKLKDFCDILCPDEQCRKPLDQASQCFKNLAPEDSRKFQKIQKMNFVNSDPNLKLCPMSDCEGVVIFTKGETIFCLSCGLIFCQTCMNPFHDGQCEANEVMILETNLQYKQCQKCRQVLERTMGCNHMTCVCKYEFCYVCGQNWKNAHYECRVGLTNVRLEREREQQLEREMRGRERALERQMEREQRRVQRENQRMAQQYGFLEEFGIDQVIRFSEEAYYQQTYQQQMEDEEMALAMAINMSMMEEKHEERLGLNEVIAVGERIVEEEEKVERRYEEE